MILRLPIGLVGSNCYIVYDQEKRLGVIVDPSGDTQPISHEIQQRNIQVLYILNTHGHFDHTAANARMKSEFNVPLGLHPNDQTLLKEGGGASWFRIPVEPSPKPDLDLIDDLTLEVGDYHIQVIHTPGHTPGSVCFYIPEEHGLLTGDTLFAGSVGRTDLPGGDHRQLSQSLKRIASFPIQTSIYPGHGEPTTLQQELDSNPWLQQ